MAANPFQQDAAAAAFRSLPRLAGRLTAELILRSPQGLNPSKEYELDLRGERGTNPHRKKKLKRRKREEAHQLADLAHRDSTEKEKKNTKETNARAARPRSLGTSTSCNPHCENTHTHTHKKLTTYRRYIRPQPFTHTINTHTTTTLHLLSSSSQETRSGRLKTWERRRTNLTPSIFQTTRL